MAVMTPRNDHGIGIEGDSSTGGGGSSSAHNSLSRAAFVKVFDLFGAISADSAELFLGTGCEAVCSGLSERGLSYDAKLAVSLILCASHHAICEGCVE